MPPARMYWPATTQVGHIVVKALADARLETIRAPGALISGLAARVDRKGQRHTFPSGILPREPSTVRRVHAVKVSMIRPGPTAERLLAALRDRLALEQYGEDRYKVVLSTGDRAFPVRSVESVLGEIASDRGVDDWTEHLHVQ